MVSLHRTLTKKDNKYQLKIYSRVEAGFCFSFPFSVREFCLVWNYGDLVHIVSDCVWISSAVSGKHYFLSVLHHLWFLFPLPYITLSLEGRDLIKAYHHVGLNTPKSLTLCTLSCCGFLLNFHLLKEETSQMILAWVMLFSMGVAVCHYVMLCFFSKIIGGFSPRAQDLSGSFPL